MTHAGLSDCDHRTGCITCGDEAIEMLIVRIDSERELALCESKETGERSTVEIALVQPVTDGDTLLVHAGTAIANLGATPDTAGGAGIPPLEVPA